jgi:hypothetical protein
MAALNFPTSPTLNQIYTANGKSWKWDGTAWKSFNTLSTSGGGTGLTSIISGNAFLSSNSAGTALTYRTFTAGSGMQITVSPNNVTFAATGVTAGTVTGTGTSGYLPMWTASGTALTDSIINQYESVIIVSGSIKAITKSFKIDHPLDPENKYLEHGSLEGPEHGIYQRGRASGYKEVKVSMPDYFMALGEDSYSIQITPRVNANLYVSESNVKGFKVKRIGGFIFSNQYIEFDYFVVAERKDVKVELIQSKK